jgi:hypothetical protein
VVIYPPAADAPLCGAAMTGRSCEHRVYGVRNIHSSSGFRIRHRLLMIVFAMIPAFIIGFTFAGKHSRRHRRQDACGAEARRPESNRAPDTDLRDRDLHADHRLSDRGVHDSRHDPKGTARRLLGASLHRDPLHYRRRIWLFRRGAASARVSVQLEQQGISLAAGWPGGRLVFHAKIGIFPAHRMRKCRKYAILINTTVASGITPTTDSFNMMLIAGPLCVLDEVGIVISSSFAKTLFRISSP